MLSSSSRNSMRLDDLSQRNGTPPRTGVGGGGVGGGERNNGAGGHGVVPGGANGAGNRVQEFDVLSLQLSHQNGNKSVSKLDQLLHETVIKNDLQRVQALLESGIKTSSIIHLNRTPLHWAAMHGHTEMIRLLMEHKCDLESKDKLGMTPLLVAAWYGHAEAVRLLMQSGANSTTTDNKGQTLLHCACRNDHLDVIRLLLQMRAGQLQLNRLDKAGQTPLHLTVLNDDVDAVRIMLDAGAQPQIKDKHHERNALHWAAVKGYDEVLEVLLQQPLLPLDDQEAQWHTALHLASEFSHRRCVRLLLRYQANAFTTDDKGRTALHVASSLGYSGVVQQLCSHHPTLVSAQDRKGNTAMHLAVMGNHHQTVLALLQAGALIDALNLREQTALHLAAELGFLESAEVLLNNGADLSLCERSGRSALYVAARGSYPALVDLLIRAQRVRQQQRTGSITSLIGVSGFSRKASLERNTSLDSTDTHRTFLPGDTDAEFNPSLSRQQSQLSRQVSEQSNYGYAGGSGGGGSDLLLEGLSSTSINCSTVNGMSTSVLDGSTLPCGPTPLAQQQSSFLRQQLLWQQQQLNQSKQMRDMLGTVARQYLDNEDWKRLAKHWQFSEEQMRAIEHQYTGRSSFKEHGHRLLLIWLHALPPYQNALRELLVALRCIHRSDVADRVRKRLTDDRLVTVVSTGVAANGSSAASRRVDALNDDVTMAAGGMPAGQVAGGFGQLVAGELGDSLKVGRALNRMLASLLNLRRRRRCDCLPADHDACGYCCIS